MQTTNWLQRHFPFNGEQIVNILGEIGPLFAMFIVNGVYGIAAGTWALIGCTVLSLIASLVVLGRPPIMPFIAGAVSVTFGALTLITGNAMWVQIKVTIFNALFALFLVGGLWVKHNFFKYVFDKTFHYTDEGWNKFTWSFAIFFLLTAVANEYVRRVYHDEEFYRIFGYSMSGVNVWILFKVAIVLPVSGIYAWVVTRLMQKYRLPDPVHD